MFDFAVIPSTSTRFLNSNERAGTRVINTNTSLATTSNAGVNAAISTATITTTTSTGVVLPSVSELPHDLSSRSAGNLLQAFTVSSFNSAQPLTLPDSTSSCEQNSSQRRNGNSGQRGGAADGGSSFATSVSGDGPQSSSLYGMSPLPETSSANRAAAKVASATDSSSDRRQQQRNGKRFAASTGGDGGGGGARPRPPPLASLTGVSSQEESPQGQSALAQSPTPPSPPVFLDTASVMHPTLTSAIDMAGTGGSAAQAVTGAPSPRPPLPPPTPSSDANWVEYDVYLGLTKALLPQRALQDRVAELCCPVTVSANRQTRLVCIEAVLSFLLHGSGVTPPMAVPAPPTRGTVVSSAPNPSSVTWSSNWSSEASSSFSNEAQRMCFPLFCLLGAKLCTLSEHTHAIRTIHTPAPPLAISSALSPQPTSTEPTTRNAGASNKKRPDRLQMLLLFTEQLLTTLPDLPRELLYTTSPGSGVVVPAPAEDAGDVWHSWQATPRAARQCVSYDALWGVVTLQRFAVLLERWGMSPAAVIQRLCDDNKNSRSDETAKYSNRNIENHNRAQVAEAPLPAPLNGARQATAQQLVFPTTQSTSYLSIPSPHAPFVEESVQHKSAEAASVKGPSLVAAATPAPLSGATPPSSSAATAASSITTTTTNDTAVSSRQWDFSSLKAGAAAQGESTPVHGAVRTSAARRQQRHRNDAAYSTGSFFGSPIVSDDAEGRLEDVCVGEEDGEEGHPYNTSLPVDPKALLLESARRAQYGQVHRYDVPPPPRPTSATQRKDTGASCLRTFASNGGVVPAAVSSAGARDAWGSKRTMQMSYVPSPPKVQLPRHPHQNRSGGTPASLPSGAEGGRYNDVFTPLPPRPGTADLQRRSTMSRATVRSAPGPTTVHEAHPYNVDGAVRNGKKRSKSHKHGRSSSRHIKKQHADAGGVIASDAIRPQEGTANDAATTRVSREATNTAVVRSGGIGNDDPAVAAQDRAGANGSPLNARRRTEQVNVYVQALMNAAARRREEFAASATSRPANLATSSANNNDDNNDAAVTQSAPASLDGGDPHAHSGRSNTSANANSLNGGRPVKGIATVPAAPNTFNNGSTQPCQRTSTGVQHVPAPPPTPPSRPSNPHSSILQSWENSMMSASGSDWHAEDNESKRAGATEQATEAVRSAGAVLQQKGISPLSPPPAELHHGTEVALFDNAAALVPSTTSSASHMTMLTPSRSAVHHDGDHFNSDTTTAATTTATATAGSAAAAAAASTTTRNADAAVHVGGNTDDSGGGGVVASEQAVLLVSHTPDRGLVVTSLQLPFRTHLDTFNGGGVSSAQVVVTANAQTHTGIQSMASSSASSASTPSPIMTFNDSDHDNAGRARGGARRPRRCSVDRATDATRQLLSSPEQTPEPRTTLQPTATAQSSNTGGGSGIPVLSISASSAGEGPRTPSPQLQLLDSGESADDVSVAEGHAPAMDPSKTQRHLDEKGDGEAEKGGQREVEAVITAATSSSTPDASPGPTATLGRTPQSAVATPVRASPVSVESAAVASVALKQQPSPQPSPPTKVMEVSLSQPALVPVESNPAAVRSNEEKKETTIAPGASTTARPSTSTTESHTDSHQQAVPPITPAPPLSRIAAQLRALIAPVLQAVGRGYLTRRRLGRNARRSSASPAQRMTQQQEPHIEDTAAKTDAASVSPLHPALEGRRSRMGRPPPLTAFAVPETPSALQTPVRHSTAAAPSEATNNNKNTSAAANNTDASAAAPAGAADAKPSEPLGQRGVGGRSASLRGPPSARDRKLNRSVSSHSSGTSSHDHPSSASPTHRLFAIYGVPSSSAMENSSSSWLPPPPSSSAFGQSNATVTYVASYNESGVLEARPVRPLRAVERSWDTMHSASFTVPGAKDGSRAGHRDGMASTHTLPPPRDDGRSRSGEQSGRRRFSGSGSGSSRTTTKPEGQSFMTSITVPPSVDAATVVSLPPSLMKPLLIPSRERTNEDAVSSILRDSTEDFINLLHSRLGSAGSCTVPFLGQTANGPLLNSALSSSPESSSPRHGGSGSGNASTSAFRRRLSNSTDNDWAVRSARALLRVQRVGRGYLARHQLAQRYRDEREEDDLDALLKDVMLRGPPPPPAPQLLFEDGEQGHARALETSADGVAPRLVPSGVMGLSSAASCNTPMLPSPSSSATPLPSPAVQPLPPPVTNPTLLSNSDAVAPSSPPLACLGPPLSPFQVPADELTPSQQSSASAYVTDGVCDPSTVIGSSTSGSKSGGGVGSLNEVPGASTVAAERHLRETSPFVTPDTSHYLMPPALVSGAAHSPARRPSPPGEFARSNSLSLSKEAATTHGCTSAMASIANAFNNALMNPHHSATGNDADTMSLPGSASRRRMVTSPPPARVSFSREAFSPVAKHGSSESAAPSATTAASAEAAAGPAEAPVGGNSPRKKLVEGIYGAFMVPPPSAQADDEAVPKAADALGEYVDDGEPEVIEEAVVEKAPAAVGPAGPIPCWKATSAAAGAVMTPMEGSLFAASGRSGRSMSSANSLPFDFSTTAHAVGAMSQAELMFSGATMGSMTPAQWALDGVEVVDSSSRFDDVDSPSEDNEDSRGSSESDSDDEANSSDEDVSEADAFRKDISHVENGGAEPACFGAAAHLLRGEKAQLTREGAATLLQRVGRGYLCRRHQHFLFMVSISFTEVALLQRVAMGFLTRRKMGLEYHVNRLVREKMEYWELRNRAAIRLHAVVRGFIARQRVKRLQRKLFTRVELRTALELPDPDE